MKIRRQRHYDRQSINKWLKARGEDLISEQSDLAFIIPGVAAAQLLLCEQNTYIFDSLVTNPLVSSPTRDKALNALIVHMLDASCGARIVAFSADSNLISRAQSLGFKAQPHVVLTYHKG